MYLPRIMARIGLCSTVSHFMLIENLQMVHSLIFCASYTRSCKVGHMMSIVAIPAAYNSLSHVDWAVAFCFLETDKIGVAFNRMALSDISKFVSPLSNEPL